MTILMDTAVVIFGMHPRRRTLRRRGRFADRLCASTLSIVSLVLMPSLCLAWGDDAHVYINQVAAQKIPVSMPKFLRDAAVRLAYLGPEPDRWKDETEYALKNAQAPDHYINLEKLHEFAELPTGRHEFYSLLYEKRCNETQDRDHWLPERVGLLPYATIEIYERLKVAFRNYRYYKNSNRPTQILEQDIVFYAGWLGHYVADGAQPLHTTIRYDGWIGENPHRYTTEPGIHAEFETYFVSRNIVPQDFAHLVGAPVRLKNPFSDFVQYLKRSNALVETVYQLEKAGGFRDNGTPESLKFTEARLAAGSQMLLNLWYTAWVDSGAEERLK